MQKVDTQTWLKERRRNQFFLKEEKNKNSITWILDQKSSDHVFVQLKIKDISIVFLFYTVISMTISILTKDRLKENLRQQDDELVIYYDLLQNSTVVLCVHVWQKD